MAGLRQAGLPGCVIMRTLAQQFNFTQGANHANLRVPALPGGHRSQSSCQAFASRRIAAGLPAWEVSQP